MASVVNINSVPFFARPDNSPSHTIATCACIFCIEDTNILKVQQPEIIKEVIGRFIAAFENGITSSTREFLIIPQLGNYRHIFIRTKSAVLHFDSCY